MGVANTCFISGGLTKTREASACVFLSGFFMLQILILFKFSTVKGILYKSLYLDFV